MDLPKQKRVLYIANVCSGLVFGLVYFYLSRYQASTAATWLTKNGFYHVIIDVFALVLSFVCLLLLFHRVMNAVFWRCPKCSKYLGDSLRVKYCSTCGAKLTE